MSNFPVIPTVRRCELCGVCTEHEANRRAHEASKMHRKRTLGSHKKCINGWRMIAIDTFNDMLDQGDSVKMIQHFSLVIYFVIYPGLGQNDTF